MVAPAARLVVADTPVPDSVVPTGVVVVELAIARVPPWTPPAVGVKVTATVQEAPAARVAPQVLVWAYGPLTVIEVSVALPGPGLLTVTVFAAVVLPTATLPNASEPGLAETGVWTTVPPSVPTSWTVTGPPDCPLGMVSVPVVMPDAGAVYETSTWHHMPGSVGLAPFRLVPQGLAGSGVTVKPPVAEMPPRPAAERPVL